jgi:hypothetical protein
MIVIPFRTMSQIAPPGYVDCYIPAPLGFAVGKERFPFLNYAALRSSPLDPSYSGMFSHPACAITSRILNGYSVSRHCSYGKVRRECPHDAHTRRRYPLRLRFPPSR